MNSGYHKPALNLEGAGLVLVLSKKGPAGGGCGWMGGYVLLKEFSNGPNLGDVAL